MNATVASGLQAPEITQYFDSCTLCLSKGLGAPVGSVIAASADFIGKAQRYRKMFGGGMRQAGILAAAGIYALENNVERLADDHFNAKLLAERISGAPGLRVEPANVETNIIYLQLDPDEARVDAPGLAAAMSQRGVLALAMGRYRHASGDAPRRQPRPRRSKPLTSCAAFSAVNNSSRQSD